MAAIRRGGDDYLFPGALAGRPISASAIRLVVERIGARCDGARDARVFSVVVRGSRIARDLAEQCLAHAIGNAVEQAYNRTDLLERRRPIMTSWASFCAATPTQRSVVPVRASAGHV